MEKLVSKLMMEKAFAALDRRLPKDLTLILGGGGCMILAHGYPLATIDVDALPLQASFEEIDPFVKEVAVELGLSADWLNPYFSSFTYVLPHDYQARLVEVFSGRRLTVRGLGKVEMLIMKCFAHRPKDLGHARALMKGGVDVKLVEDVIGRHLDKALPGAQDALDFLDQLKEEFE